MKACELGTNSEVRDELFLHSIQTLISHGTMHC